MAGKADKLLGAYRESDAAIGAPVSGGSAGSLLYVGAGGVLGQTSELYYDAADGRLGIGTAAPAGPLDVAGSSGSVVVDALGTLSAGADLKLTNSGPQILNTGGGTLRIKGSSSGAGAVTLNETGGGRVGAGTASPRQQFSVGSNLDLYSGNANAPSVCSIRGSTGNNLTVNAGGAGGLYLNFDSGSGGVNFGNGSSGVVASITSGGKFGLGLATGAQAYIHVAASNGGVGQASFKVNAGTFLTTPEAGTIEYGGGGRFSFTDLDEVRRFPLLAENAAVTAAGAPYANSGYVSFVIGGTTLKLMTTNG